MQRLRNARLLARQVLVWFALAVGVAIASPLIQPQSSTLVCSAGGALKFLPVGEDAGAVPAGAGLLDCPLCLQMAAPPVQAPVLVVRDPDSPGKVPQTEPVRVVRAAGPSPGRGPPAQA
jgi:hypothetical protein